MKWKLNLYGKVGLTELSISRDETVRTQAFKAEIFREMSFCLLYEAYGILILKLLLL